MFKITKKTGEEKVKWGWAMYDWANNVYSLVITTAIFPLYFTALTSSKDENGNVIDTVIFFGNEFTNSQLILSSNQLGSYDFMALNSVGCDSTRCTSD